MIIITIITLVNKEVYFFNGSSTTCQFGWISASSMNLSLWDAANT